MIPDSHPAILMAEDDPDECLLARKAFERTRIGSSLFTVADGEELMDYLRRQGKYADPTLSPRPGLVLLDLNMPKKDGREALREIKTDPGLRQIPVVVLTTSGAADDVFLCYDAGANSFVTKPETLTSLAAVFARLEEYWFRTVRLAGESGGPQ